VAALIYIPPTVHKGSLSLCILATIYLLFVFCLFIWGFSDDTHSDWGEIESQCYFDLLFPLVLKNAGYFFKYLFTICMSLSTVQMFILLAFNFFNSFYILDITLLSGK
jgi:hypothetical protein